MANETKAIVSYDDVDDFGGTGAGDDNSEDRYVGVFTGSGGAIKVTTAHGTDVVFSNLPAGVCHPGQFKTIWATGTTATGIRGLLSKGGR